jgi:beta-glucuronidase
LPPDRVLGFAVMRLPRILALALLAAILAAPPGSAADVPTRETLHADGPTGRYLMGGQWLFRLDPAGQGLSQRFQRQTSTTGWAPVAVPHAWNVGGETEESLRGTVGWYRKDFELPSRSAALQWAVRFESANYRVRAWLNGREIGSHSGAAIPFTLRLRAARPSGVNRLVVRVDSRRDRTSFPPFALSSRGTGTGGWWNYGGLLREVYLERLDTVAFKTMRVLPRAGGGGARVDFTVGLENVTRGTRRVSAVARYGSQRVSLGSATIRPGGTGVLRRRLSVARPIFWSPARPHLYPVTIQVSSGGRVVGGWSLKSGIRSIRVSGGRLLLNGRPLSLRGVGVHEDNRAQGFAVDNAWRRRLVDEAKALGATMLRAHYPLHPYIHELADREGLLIWSEVPVYQMQSQVIARTSTQRRAVSLLRDNVENNLNHPSIAVWSIANELSATPDAGQARYIRRARAAAKAIDPARPVGIAFAGYPSAGCQRAAYRGLDVLGINDYFGWYPGPDGRLMDRHNLSAYLDTVRACYRAQALMITEFGAEANRDGPAEEKGTWAFQRDWVNHQLATFAGKPWLSGALYWALNEFRIKPDWEGGNPRPAPPIHQKGLLTYDGMVRKPAWEDVRQWFARTAQF